MNWKIVGTENGIAEVYVEDKCVLIINLTESSIADYIRDFLGRDAKYPERLRVWYRVALVQILHNIDICH